VTILSRILSFASEQQRLAYEDTTHPYTFFASLEGSEADLASAILRYKGVVLDSIIEDRLVAEAGKANQGRVLIARLTADKNQLGQLLLQNPSEPNATTKERIDKLEQEVEQIEGQLARNVSDLGRARRALNVTLEQVQAVIPRDASLIEYLRYKHYWATASSSNGTPQS
jgi:hypothetical protein